MDPYRRKFEIGLYHGDDTGHVMVHCNGKIIIIDFDIKEEKQYSFYLGPELFNLDFKNGDKEGQFVYSILKDNTTPTPLNIAREKSEKEDHLLMAIGAGIVSVIVLVILFL